MEVRKRFSRPIFFCSLMVEDGEEKKEGEAKVWESCRALKFKYFPPLLFGELGEYLGRRNKWDETAKTGTYLPKHWLAAVCTKGIGRCTRATQLY